MKRVRKAKAVLDDPVAPLVGLGDCEHVEAVREVHIPLGDVFEGGLVPGDVHILVVDLPVNAVLALPDLLGEGEVEVVVGEAVEGGRGGVALHDGVVLDAVFALAIRGSDALVGGECGRGSAFVVEDGCGELNVGYTAETGRGKGDVEPVVSDGLVGIDGDVVALANRQEDAADCSGVNGDEIGLHDGHLVADEGDGEGVVDAGVDDAESVALAGLQLYAVVGAAAVGVHCSLSVYVQVAAVSENLP
jgi:hypothetical protein